VEQVVTHSPDILLTALHDKDTDTLCRWWCEFNCFTWPDDFPIDKPVGWDALDMAGQQNHPKAKRMWRELGRHVTQEKRLAYWREYYLPRMKMEAK
jgi:hypothetical protein